MVSGSFIYNVIIFGTTIPTSYRILKYKSTFYINDCYTKFNKRGMLK